MKLKLTVHHRDIQRDVAIVADATATVGTLIERIEFQLGGPDAPPSARALLVNRGTPQERVVESGQTLADAGIRSGESVSITVSRASAGSSLPVVGTLNVVSGPDAPNRFPLHSGTNFIGRARDANVRLSDPLVSKRHAKVNVSDFVEIIDDGSANGVVVGQHHVDRCVLPAGARATVGDTEFTVTLVAGHAASSSQHAIEFNRSPRLDPQYEGITLKAPEPPKPPTSQRFPVSALLAPIVMATMMYAVTRNAMSLLFVAMSPIMLIGNWYENRRAGRKAFQTAVANYRAAIVDLSVQLQYAADLERQGRRSEHPSAAEIEAATRDLTDLLWTRRPEHESFLCCRVGLGTQPSRNSVEMPQRNDTTPELWRQLVDVVGQFAAIDRVPIVARLNEIGNIGVCGPSIASEPVLANVVGQFVSLHSPAELVLAAVAGDSAATWDWMKWLPHSTSEFSPIEAAHLAANAAEANALVSSIEGVISERVDARDDAPPLPAVLLVVNDDAPIERARLVQIAERGPAVNIFVVWQALSRQRLPAACRIFVESDPGHDFQFAGIVPGGQGVADLEAETISADAIAALARRLAPVVDSGVRVDDQTDLPRSVSFLELAGLELGADPEAIIESWRANNALPPPPDAPRQKRPNTLRAVVGYGTAGPMHLDLREQGPHALVGGTTGAGKSEFLQSWVLGMAAMHSPSRVTFLFVDYKGGSAFEDCVPLPHCVGLVTDLSPHLVHRALTSLNAELHYRERLLNRKNAKDLFDLEKQNDPEAPPSLVIVVDEFAALVHEVPEFVDGVVNVAQRGRSLGLNLILATQRPAGVIKDNLRANTNLRVALRMADEADSDDVVGSKLAATFDPSLPGRGVVKTGPGRLTAFQSAYAGGQTTDEPPRPTLDVADLVFGQGALWEAPEEPSRPMSDVSQGDVATDIKRVVATIGKAAELAQIPSPRKPWLPDLKAIYPLELLPSERMDSRLVYGVVDKPELQLQPEIAILPDTDGNVAVYGAGGAGKTVFLRTLTLAAAQGFARGGPTHVYGLDFGARGLQMLEELPHVGSIIGGEDHERIQRLLRRLRDVVDERADRYSAVDAGSVTEYRERSGQRDEPRILLLVDNVGAFRNAYEGVAALNRYWDLFLSLAADGRRLGVHVIITADRANAVPTSLASSIQRRLVLRLANEMDYMSLDVDPEGFSEQSPPGRGFVDGDEVQVAVLGGVSNEASQADEIRKLARSMRLAGITDAPAIETMPDSVNASELPEEVAGRPTLGIWDETLGPIGFEPMGTFVVAGPPLSGRSTTVASMIWQLRRTRPKMRFVAFGERRSPLAGAVDWEEFVVGHTEIGDRARDLVDEVEHSSPGEWCFVIENVGDLMNTDAEQPLQQLVKAARTSDNFVIAEGETSSLVGSYSLLGAVKVNRTGIALQPEQSDGDVLFKTSFPRVTRKDFPLGRGLFTSGGHTFRVQVAQPE